MFRTHRIYLKNTKSKGFKNFFWNCTNKQYVTNKPLIMKNVSTKTSPWKKKIPPRDR